LFGLGQWQAADSVDLFGDNYLTMLEIGNHPEEFGAIGPGARCLLLVDAGDVIPCCPSAVYDICLPGEVLFIGTDSEINASYFHIC